MKKLLVLACCFALLSSAKAWGSDTITYVLDHADEKFALDTLPTTTSTNDTILPTFNGGNVEKFRAWTIKNIQYPKNSNNTRIQGKVVVSFVVNEKGKVRDVKVVQGIFGELDDEVVRVVRLSPKWKPGTINGKPVRVKFSLPVIFKLDE